jgi:Xaa-Pro dipeptidase
MPISGSSLLGDSGALASPVDLARLRVYRYQRIQQQMSRCDLPVILLTDPINIRYATGLALMVLWSATNLMHYVLIPAEGAPVIFEYPEAVHTGKALWPDVRPAKTWQYRFSVQHADEVAGEFAAEIADLVRGWGFGARLGVDALDARGFHALSAAGLEVTDADEALQAARRVKSADELALLRQSAAIAEAALSAFEQAIRPGISEHGLLATFWSSMLSFGGEYCYSRMVASGERTNPWFQEASTRIVRPGDLVAIDTDMIGPEGYACDISRTFLCGDTATPEQREAYRAAADFVEGAAAVLAPGLSYAEVAQRAPRLPGAYSVQRYPCMLHGIGMDDESPFVDFAEGSHLVPDGELQPGMVVCVECYAGAVGASHGVKMEDEFAITDTGAIRLTHFPRHPVLAGR